MDWESYGFVIPFDRTVQAGACSIVERHRHSRMRASASRE
jgi:hypothetical protein